MYREGFMTFEKISVFHRTYIIYYPPKGDKLILFVLRIIRCGSSNKLVMRTNILFDMLNVEQIANPLSSSTQTKPKNKTGILKR